MNQIAIGTPQLAQEGCRLLSALGLCELRCAQIAGPCALAEVAGSTGAALATADAPNADDLMPFGLEWEGS